MSAESGRQFDFDRVIDRRHTASVKWDLHKRRDVIPMRVAEMDFAAPPAILAALRGRLDHGVLGYSHPDKELVRTVLAMLAEAHGWKVDASWLVWLPGLGPGLNLACRAAGGPGDAVLVPVPVYPPFLEAPDFAGRQLQAVPLACRGGRYEMDLEALERAITPRTRLLMLCNPHNPVGRVYTRAELEALAELCLRRGLVICSDEVHCGLILDEDKRHVSTATLSAEVADRTITLLAPSKTYNIPGLQCGFAVIPNPALRAAFKRAGQGVTPGVGVMGLEACKAAYRDCESWRGALLEYLRANRDLLEAAVAGMDGLSMPHVEATYLAWIDCRAAGIDDPERFFEAAGVGLWGGQHFGTPGFARLTFGCPRRLLEQAIERMQRALAGRSRA